MSKFWSFSLIGLCPIFYVSVLFCGRKNKKKESGKTLPNGLEDLQQTDQKNLGSLATVMLDRCVTQHSPNLMWK